MRVAWRNARGRLKTMTQKRWLDRMRVAFRNTPGRLFHFLSATCGFDSVKGVNCNASTSDCASDEISRYLSKLGTRCNRSESFVIIVIVIPSRCSKCFLDHSSAPSMDPSALSASVRAQTSCCCPLAFALALDHNPCFCPYRDG